MEWTGGCACGAVRYSIAAERLPPVYACHCKDCQTKSGASFALQMMVAEDAMSIAGAVVEARIVTPSGAIQRHLHCPTCLTRLANVSNMRSGVMIVRAGTLDDSAQMSPRGHIFVRSKQPWIMIDDAAPRYEGAPDVEEWLALLYR